MFNQNQKLLMHDPSSLSFHIDQTQQAPNSPTIPYMPSDTKTLIGLYMMSYLIHLFVCYYAIHKFIQDGNSVVDATLVMSTLRALFMSIFVLCYIKKYEPNLIYLDDDHTKLIIVLAVLNLIASLMNYLSLAILPLSQAATIGQLVPGMIGLFSYILIQPHDMKIFLYVGTQIAMALLFDANFILILFMILSPACLGLMASIRQVITKPINQFTLLLYATLLGLPVYLILTTLGGSFSGLSNFYLFIGSIVMSAFQLQSYIFMNEIIKSQLPTEQIWMVSLITIALTIPFQLILFQQEISIIPLIAQVIIFGTSILQKGQ